MSTDTPATPLSSERALYLAESRKRELDSWVPVFKSCRWWEWRKRRRIQEMVAGIIADIERLVSISARLDGDL